MHPLVSSGDERALTPAKPSPSSLLGRKDKYEVLLLPSAEDPTNPFLVQIASSPFSTPFMWSEESELLELSLSSSRMICSVNFDRCPLSSSVGSDASSRPDPVLVPIFDMLCVTQRGTEMQAEMCTDQYRR